MLEALALVAHADSEAMTLELRVLVHIFANQGRTSALSRLHGIWAGWAKLMILTHAVESMKVILFVQH